MNKQAYLSAISRRGDRYGGHGGILDLLLWCGKECTLCVTADEARRFLENPQGEYEPTAKQKACES